MWNNLGVAYEHDGGTKNFVRIEGVHSHTAKSDVPVEPEGDTGL